MSDNIQEEIEDKIIDCINSGVTGRLIIFKPDKNILGADLAVERRGKYKENPIYLQINSFVGPAREDVLIKDFLEDDFKTEKNFYLIFVYFDEVGQKINNYIWLIPSNRFLDSAKIVKSPEGENLLRFESVLDTKKKNEYSKFLVDTKELGKLLLNALEEDEKISFKGTGFDEKMPVNFDTLKNFLCNARKNTFAADATPDSNPKLLTSIQLEFQKGEYLYRDIFFNGTVKFMGQEIIYQGDKPVWGMSYRGKQIGKLETNFLKESLYKLVEKCRLGGSCEYKKREFKYVDQGQGNFEEFGGTEQIFLDNNCIYELKYQGGVISDKV